MGDLLPNGFRRRHTEMTDRGDQAPGRAARRPGPARSPSCWAPGLGGLVDEVERPGAHSLWRSAGLSGRAASPAMPARWWPGGSAATPVLMLAGRAHYYEHGDAAVMRPALETLAGRSASKTLILTNAAGSLEPDMPPGSVMLITDHINFSGTNPLIGEPERPPLRRPDRTPMTRRWRGGSSRRRPAASSCMKGVYMWFSGPSFETPAEIRMARLLGRRCGRHVDGAGGDPGPLPWACGSLPARSSPTWPPA